MVLGNKQVVGITETCVNQGLYCLLSPSKEQ